MSGFSESLSVASRPQNGFSAAPPVRLYDCATALRSKNAGPFTLTVDIVLPDAETFRRVLQAPGLCASHVGALYGVPAAEVRVIPFEQILTIKVTLPRPGGSSGAPGDRDVYGCQQHFPLGDIEV